jgi:predicted alpha/beta superfamily hydrolase
MDTLKCIFPINKIASPLLNKQLMNSISSLFILLTFFCINATYSQPLQVQLPSSQAINFKSTVNGQHYELYIALPGSYNGTIKRYPVFYVPDGEWNFAMAYSIYSSLIHEGSVPEMIIVGIGWRNKEDASRNRDFSSVALPGDSNSGGAPKFLNVLKKEIISRIDSTFRSDKVNNTLCGGSLAGFFALYTLFHEPTLFNRYIVCSPSLQLDGEIIFKTEKSFAEKNHTLNAKVFISSSEVEESLFPITNFQKFIMQLKASNYKKLDLDTLVVEEMSHASQGPYSMARGLQFIFSKPQLILDTALLDQYVGQYEQNQVITRKGSSLYLNMFGGEAKLNAETSDDFYVKGAPVNCRFQRNAAGKVTGCNLAFFSSSTTFLKKLQ